MTGDGAAMTEGAVAARGGKTGEPRGGTMAMNVRHGEARDVPAVVDLAVRFLLDSQYARLPYDREHFARILGKFTEGHPHSLFLVLEREGRVAGFLLGRIAACIFSPRPVATQDLFYIEPESRGAGSKALMDGFLAWAERFNPLMVDFPFTSGVRRAEFARFVRRSGFTEHGVIYRRLPAEFAEKDKV